MVTPLIFLPEHRVLKGHRAKQALQVRKVTQGPLAHKVHKALLERGSTFSAQ